MRATSKQYPYYPTPQPQVKQWHWNPHKAADSLRTSLWVVVVMGLFGFVCYTIFSMMAGVK
jgi:hypothetical protein